MTSALISQPVWISYRMRSLLPGTITSQYLLRCRSTCG